MAERLIEQSTSDKTDVDETIIIESENDKSEIKGDESHEPIYDLSKFQITEILNNNIIQKMVAVVGEFENCEGSALVVLEKKVFPEEKSLLEEGFFNETTTMNKTFQNDIYTGYNIFPPNEHNDVLATITHPATVWHIEKFRLPEFYVIEETAELYRNITLPGFISSQVSLQWVENILNGTAEVERVIFNDPDKENGFVLVKDSKWDSTLATLHLIAISQKPIMTIRDLNSNHLPLLKNIKEAGTKAITEKYGLPASQMRIFFHYHPSFFHLHVHFTSTTLENAGTNVERAHMLTSVINNIELMSDYYQKATIPFRVCKYSAYEPYINNDESVEIKE